MDSRDALAAMCLQINCDFPHQQVRVVYLDGACFIERDHVVRGGVCSAEEAELALQWYAAGLAVAHV